MNDGRSAAVVFLSSCPEISDREARMFSNRSEDVVYLVRYERLEEKVDGIRGMLERSGVQDVRLYPADREGDEVRYLLNDLISMDFGSIVIDITFASPLHAALADFYTLNPRVVVRYTRRDRVDALGSRLPDYSALDPVDTDIVQAVSDGAVDPAEIIMAVGLSTATGYRRLAALAERGYLTAEGGRRSRRYTMDADQKTRFAVYSDIPGRS